MSTRLIEGRLVIVTTRAGGTKVDTILEDVASLATTHLRDGGLVTVASIVLFDCGVVPYPRLVGRSLVEAAAGAKGGIAVLVDGARQVDTVLLGRGHLVAAAIVLVDPRIVAVARRSPLLGNSSRAVEREVALGDHSRVIDRRLGDSGRVAR